MIVPLLILGAVVAGIGFAVVSGLFAYRFTTPPRRSFETEGKPEEFLKAYETVRFPARDGLKLEGWFVPCPGATKAVVLLHGYGCIRTQLLARAKLFHDQGYAVLLYDARGHGRSEGELVSFGYYEKSDVLGALDWLRAKGFGEIGCLGISMGGATLAMMGPELTGVKWVVIESVYPTLTNAVDQRFRRSYRMPGWLGGMLMVPFAEWRLGLKAKNVSPREGIAGLRCPVFVMTGDLDEHTLHEKAREVFDHAKEPKQWWLVPGAAHVDLYGFAKAEYEKRLLGFVGAVK